MGAEPEVLLSYTPPDLAWAGWVRRELETAGCHVRPRAWDPDPDGARADLAEAPYAVVLVSAPALEWMGADGRAALDARQATGLATLRVRVDAFGAGERIDVDLPDAPEGRLARQRLHAGLERLGLPREARPEEEATGAVRYPGDGPEISNLSRRNPVFTGRGDLLNRLRGLFARPGHDGTRGLALYGTGGVGKTQLALEYGYRHRSAYDIIWWIDAKRSTSIELGLTQLADSLDVPATMHQDERLGLLWEVLRERSRWLLVFDGAEGEDTLERYWPPGTGHVLVTSRNAAWPFLVEEALPVERWTRPESVAFLERLSSAPGDGTADLVAADLGDLPLALAQAAAYVRARSLTLAGYRELFHEHREKMTASHRPAGYGQTVMTTWHMSIEEADRIRPGARDLLILLSFCGTEHVPRALPVDRVDALPERLAAAIGTAEDYDRTVEALSTYSLLTALPDDLMVHSLVQLTVRAGLTAEERRTWAETVLRLLDRALPEEVGDSSAWLPYHVTPQVQAACDIARAYGVAPGPIATLLHNKGRYLNARSDYETARRMLEQALTLRENPAEPDELAVADTLAALTGVYMNLADLTAAERACRRSLDIRERRCGLNHAKVADIMCDLGRVLRERNRLEEARQRSERALEIGEDAFGTEHPRVADYATYLGIVLWRGGRLSEALDVHHRALRIRERVGTPHRLASTCKHIGLLYRDLRRFDLAEVFLERSVEILRSTYGPSHLDTIEVEIHLGDARRLLGFAEEAAGMLERARRQRERQLAQGHPDLALCLVKLGAALRDLGRLAEADDALRRAADIYVRTRSEDHPYVAETLVQLGPVQRLLGDAQGAVETLRRAVRIFEDNYGPYHPSLAEAWEHLAPLLAERGERDEASRWAENAVSVYRSTMRGIDWEAISPPSTP
ncbi:FxSxx-COOH system tetratricopeptide repeat protein [Thermomonospora umbrina]|uniref:Tetratricopeptide (TPR) repeat protein n=1 Tax=Thermomonospora umbrina TaxID=111806 RepID=A0A3D9SRZ1_9ACTN|nr:FxSxx-COOH system tetratricopeptide repeat protein [Thermomonospora umbrina]REE95384.1 tetratricopeptide (TPR) repeat protein [Thermomonospora umbrina]